MFANPELRRAMLFAVSDWTGGFYATPSMAGSKPGYITAGNWAAMMKIGRDGYKKYAKDILDAGANIKRELGKISEIEVLSRHDTSIVAFNSRTLNIIALCDHLSSKFRWNLNKLVHPISAHIVLTPSNLSSWKKFISDVKQAIEDLKKDPSLNHSSTVALYGMSGSMPNQSFLAHFFHLHTEEYLDLQ
mmetsp:Transcript_15088/g.14658  ORF Transcript_15088/g.14658 Transcript_15088/m.14658 type:complete len:189 (-) Transcript_15088:57-623(-)|eukprot:CAMPEP_0170550536 /NCGR_PEP_ID=MMETSP0211-20121228/8598_1 /TAXON_ID=311385 /ORGANISM="Pseudokeronopsis sp., Strain OXSARD2" /LENGTH=188 /DNA_ID=CAMNT_0010857153 /DNA_START=1048 /DNA_END=1614 /DNA_ORIENTATION=+